MLGSPCLDQTLDGSDIERPEDHFDMKVLTLGPHMSFDFRIAPNWPCLGPFPSPFRDVGLYLRYSDHCQWFMHSYSHIIVRPFTSVSDFTYTHISFD